MGVPLHPLENCILTLDAMAFQDPTLSILRGKVPKKPFRSLPPSGKISEGAHGNVVKRCGDVLIELLLWGRSVGISVT